MIALILSKRLLAVCCIYLCLLPYTAFPIGPSDRAVLNLDTEPLSVPTPTSATYPVHRFWSPVYGTHFFTTSETEKNDKLKNPTIWEYEGTSWKAYNDSSVTGLLPVYRFWSEKHKSYFYTINEGEKDYIMETYNKGTWKYEKTAYYAYPENNEAKTLKPVYRFWSNTLSVHFFTKSKEEMDLIIDTYPTDVWNYEGAAWYVP